jgi:hypothetical protein
MAGTALQDSNRRPFGPQLEGLRSGISNFSKQAYFGRVLAPSAQAVRGFRVGPGDRLRRTTKRLADMKITCPRRCHSSLTAETGGCATLGERAVIGLSFASCVAFQPFDDFISFLGGGGGEVET